MKETWQQCQKEMSSSVLGAGADHLCVSAALRSSSLRVRDVPGAVQGRCQESLCPKPGPSRVPWVTAESLFPQKHPAPPSLHLAHLVCHVPAFLGMVAACVGSTGRLSPPSWARAATASLQGWQHGGVTECPAHCCLLHIPDHAEETSMLMRR